MQFPHLISKIVVLICSLATAYFLTKAVFFLKQDSPPTAPHLTETSLQAQKKNLAVSLPDKTIILSRNLFAAQQGIAQSHGAESPEERAARREAEIEAVPASKRGWKLLGTMIYSGQELNRAVVRTEQGEILGREGEVIRGWKVEAITRRNMLLSRGSEKERLTIESIAQKTQNTKQTNPAPQTATLSQPSTNQDRQKVRQLLNNPIALMQATSLLKAETQGSWQGLRLVSMDQDGLFSQFGLRVGDLVLSANNIKLQSLTDLTSLPQLLNQKNINLEIVRNGSRMTLKYN